MRNERPPQDAAQLRKAVRYARQQRGLSPQQLAAQAGADTTDVDFIERHGVGTSAKMLVILDVLGIRDYASEKLSRLAELVPDNQGPAMLRGTVEAGYNQIKEIEIALAEGTLTPSSSAFPYLELLTEGLRAYRHAERLGDADQA